MSGKLPRWAPWVGLLVGLGSVGGGLYALAGRFFVTSDAYAQDKEQHAVEHKTEAEALTLVLVQTMGKQFEVFQQKTSEAEATRDRKVDVLVCMVSGGKWDALRDACDRPVPGPAPAPPP